MLFSGEKMAHMPIFWHTFLVTFESILLKFLLALKRILYPSIGDEKSKLWCFFSFLNRTFFWKMGVASGHHVRSYLKKMQTWNFMKSSDQKWSYNVILFGPSCMKWYQRVKINKVKYLPIVSRSPSERESGLASSARQTNFSGNTSTIPPTCDNVKMW